MEEIKRRLKAFKDARILYQKAKDESEQIATLLTSAAIDYSKVKVQTSPHDFTDTMARLVDLHNECVKRMNECVTAMEDAARLIDLVEEPELREILSRRYLRLDQWPDIAEVLKKDERWIYRLHERALQEIKQKIDFDQ